MNTDAGFDLLTWPRLGQGEPSCRISRPKVISFESYRTNTDTHTHRVDRRYYPDH